MHGLLTCTVKVSGLVDAVVAQPPSPHSPGEGCRSFIHRGVDDVTDDAGFVTGSSSGLPCDTAAIRSAAGVVDVSLASPQSIEEGRAVVAQIEEAFQGPVITAGAEDER